MSPDANIMMARARHNELLRECERERLNAVARAATKANRDRRTELRLIEASPSLLDRLIGRLKDAVGRTPPRKLTREPAV